MPSLLPTVGARLLLVALVVTLSGCASMLPKERSAYVLIRPVSGPAVPVPAGAIEQSIAQLVSRQNYRFTRDPQAAWLIYLDERPTSSDGSTAPRYVVGDIMRNPTSRYPDETVRPSRSDHQQHPSLAMLKQYEDAAQNRSTTTP